MHVLICKCVYKKIIIVHMWPEMRKTGFHTHSSKTHFSPSNDSCTHWLTIQAGIDTESCPGCFCCSLFMRLVIRPRALGLPSNGCISPWQADSCQAVIHHTTGWLVDHGFSWFVWYVEVKMVPMDAIWLVSKKT